MVVDFTKTYSINDCQLFSPVSNAADIWIKDLKEKNHQWLLMYQLSASEQCTCCQGLTLFTKLPNYQSIWASEQSNAMPEVWPTFVFLAFYKLTQLLNPLFFAANEYFQIFNSLFASWSQESPGQFWFGAISLSAPWSRPVWGHRQCHCSCLPWLPPAVPLLLPPG